LCVGHLGEQIEKRFHNGRQFGVNITYSYEKEELLGTAGALKNAERYLEDRFFVIYGDSYLFLDYNAVMTYFDGFHKMGLMAVFRNYNRYDSSNVSINGNMVQLYKKQGLTDGMTYIDYGASVLRKTVLDLVPTKQVYSLEKLYSQLIELQELLAYNVDKRFFEIGSMDGIEDFKRYITLREVD